MKQIHPKTYFLIFIIPFLLNNSHIYSEDYYWVKGSGNWSELNHWATSSGGSVFHSSVPGADDNVIFDSNSFSESNNDVVINVESAICANLDFSDISKNLIVKGSSEIHINNRLILSTLVNFEFDGDIKFDAEYKKYTLATLNKYFPGNITFDGKESDWEVTGGLNCGKSLILKSNFSKFAFETLNVGSTFDISSASTNVVIAGNVIVKYDFLLSGSNTIVKTTGNMQVSEYFSQSTFNGSFSIDGNLSVKELILTYGSFKINNKILSAVNCLLYLNCKVDISNSNLNISHLIEEYGTSATITSTNTSISFSGSDLQLISSIPVSFKNVNFESNGLINCSNSSIQNLNFKETGIIKGEQNHFATATFNKDGKFNGNQNFDNLNLAPGFEYQFQANKVQTINNSLNSSGNCNASIILKSDEENSQASIAKSSGTVNLDYIIVKDMNFTGGANFVSSSFDNLQNTTGLSGTLAATRNLFWVGGSGNWSDPAHWSNLSGGAGGECIPTSVDNVFFDANSFTSGAGQVLIDLEHAWCNNFDWRNVTNNPILTKDASNLSLNIFGSLWFSPTMKNQFASKIIFRSKNTGQQIKSAGNAFIDNLHFDGEGGWNLLDDLNLPDSSIYLIKGTLTSAGNKIITNNFFANYPQAYNRYLNIDNSEIYLKGNWKVSSEKLCISTANSHIFFSKMGASMEAGKNFSYNNISFTSLIKSPVQIQGSQLLINQLHFYSYGDCEISKSVVQDIIFDGEGKLINGENLFENASFKSNGAFIENNAFGTLNLSPSFIYTFTNGKTQTINTSLNAFGNCNAPISLYSDKAGSKSYFRKLNSNLIIGYITIRDIEALAGVTYTINDATDLGNNPGWIINKVISKNYYWVGGSGNWEDPMHWSVSSGGAGGAAGTCLPTQNDNVIFDQTSFSANGQTVSINSEAVNCKNMDWSAIDDNPVFKNNANSVLNVFGSLALSPNLSWNLKCPISFKGTNDNFSINLAGKTLSGDILFDGFGANWQLLSNFSTGNTFNLAQGTVVADNFDISALNFLSNTENSSVLKCNNSNISILNNWNTAKSFIFDGSNTKITLTKDLAQFSNKSIFKINFDEIEIHGLKTVFLSDSSTIKKLTVNKGSIDGANTIIDSLIFEDEAEVWGNISVKNGEFKSIAIIYQNHQFGRIDFEGEATLYMDNVFEKARFFGDARILSNNVYDTLLFSPDHTYYLGNYRTQIVNKYLSLKGNNCYKINIRALSTGATANISFPAGNVEGYALNIKNIKATGGAKFYAAGPSSDLGDNIGWFFGSPSGYIYGFSPDSIYLEGQIANLSTDKFNTNPNTTFNWSNGNTSSNFSTSEAVHISIDVVYYSDPAQCSFTDETNIYFAKLKHPTCRTFADGEIAIKTDKTKAYSYLWSNGSLNSSIDNLKAGNYNVTVTDNNTGEKAYRSFILKEPDTLKAKFSVLKQPSCIGSNNGAIDLEITGGNKPYNISWQDNPSISDLSRINLAPATYQVLIKDWGNCENVTRTAIIKDPEKLSANILKINGITCYGNKDAKLSFTANGGTKPYSCVWSTGTNADTIYNIAIGKYSVKITDAYNCSIEYDTINIEDYNKLEYSFRTKNQLCYGKKSGEIEIFATGGSEPYSFKWSHTAKNASKLDSLLPGIYAVTISDTFKCETLNRSFQILAGKGIDLLNSNVTEPLCYNDNTGEISMEFKGGNGNLKYKIDNDKFQPNSIFKNISAGMHSIIAQDDSLCEFSFPIELNGPEKLEAIYQVTNPNCLRSKNGIIELFPNGGIPPYSIIIQDSTQNVITSLDQLGVGAYAILITDKNNCIFDDTVYLTASDCEQELIIPNVFSPNKDGENEYFEIKSTNTLENYSINIYSRWGAKVFSSKSIDHSWDGNFNGRECAAGVYYYVIEYFFDGRFESKKGFLHLFK